MGWTDYNNSNEISYRCFTTCGGLRNPRFFTKRVCNPRGEYIRTAYCDIGHGPLHAWP